MTHIDFIPRILFKFQIDLFDPKPPKIYQLLSSKISSLDLSFFKVKISINNVQYHEIRNCRKRRLFYIILIIIIHNVIKYINFSSLLWKGQMMKTQILVLKRFGHCTDPHRFNLMIWYKNI